MLLLSIAITSNSATLNNYTVTLTENCNHKRENVAQDHTVYKRALVSFELN